MINKTVPPGNTQINSIFRDSWYGLLIIKEKVFSHQSHKKSTQYKMDFKIKSKREIKFRGKIQTQKTTFAK